MACLVYENLKDKGFSKVYICKEDSYMYMLYICIVIAIKMVENKIKSIKIAPIELKQKTMYTCTGKRWTGKKIIGNMGS